MLIDRWIGTWVSPCSGTYSKRMEGRGEGEEKDGDGDGTLVKLRNVDIY